MLLKGASTKYVRGTSADFHPVLLIRSRKNHNWGKTIRDTWLLFLLCEDLLHMLIIFHSLIGMFDLYNG